jgi:glutamate--cysteine ligase
MSFRSQVWSDTDPDRTGMLGFVFEDGFGFERWVDYLLDVPMYFVNRNGHYVDCAGQSFRAFLDGRLPALPGERPTLKDWADHMTTAFPEVRLKRYLEMRGADGGPWNRLCALPAFWVGLLYDRTALDAALGSREGLLARRARGAPPRGAAHRAQDPVPRRHRARAWPLEALKIAGNGLEAARRGATRRARTRRVPGAAARIRAGEPVPGRSASSSCSTGPGRARSIRCSASSRT